MGGCGFDFMGAKRSMGRHVVSTCQRRPSLDLLESRCLLSGGIDRVDVSVAPALIVGLNFQASTHPPDRGQPAMLPSISFTSPPPLFGRSQAPQSLPLWGGLSVAEHSGFETLVVFQSPPPLWSRIVDGQETLAAASGFLTAVSLAPGGPHGDPLAEVSGSTLPPLDPASPPRISSRGFDGGFREVESHGFGRDSRAHGSIDRRSDGGGFHGEHRF